MGSIVIAEKASQARDLRAAIGSRFGPILPAEGHLLRLAEPEEVDPRWKRWSYDLLKPAGLYPTRPDASGNKPAKLAAITEALRGADRVIIATDCDREGQLIGQEILEHLGFTGEVLRALFTAQDPVSLRQAFADLKPNAAYGHLYAAAVARRQADQVFNLSLTRAATRALVPAGSTGVIGIGRVKTPTLAILCRREHEIAAFKPTDYFEIVATATVATGSFRLRHAPPPSRRILDRARAEAIAAAATGFTGPLSVAVEDRREAPPPLYDLPALQKLCGRRWGWTADKTLAVAQDLYDGEGKKLITYPRAEARHLAESQIADVPAILGALGRLRGFADLDLARPVIRRGARGVFHDQALEGVAHHAVIPNVNVMADVEARIARLDEDGKRLFAVICRAYLAAMMPDYEYRQTTVTLTVPGPDPAGHVFRAIGRIPVRPGWKAAYGKSETPESEKGDSGKEGAGKGEEVEEILPPLAEGDAATLDPVAVEAKRTQPPPRYGEGSLIDAMQNAWRFVTDPVQRARLKEARGIGTPATRATVIEGLKRQGLIAPQGRLIVPTAAGLALHDRLAAAAPALTDPGTTAQWELRLDAILRRAQDSEAVIDGIAAEAGALIEVLRRQGGQSLPVTASATPTRTDPTAPVTPRMARRKGGKPGAATPKRRAAPLPPGGPPPRPPHRAGPTDRMAAFARSLAQRRGIALPEGVLDDFARCRAFLDAHARRQDAPEGTGFQRGKT